MWPQRATDRARTTDRLRPTFRARRLVAIAATLAAVVGLSACGDAGGDERGSVPEGGKVTVAGDSISVGIGTQLRDAIGDTREVKVIGESGTGLARPDSFDWPARLETLARDFPPDVLVLSLGSNDAQDLLDPDGDMVAPLADDEAWDAEYSARLARSFDAFADTGTTVLWLGHVRTEEDRVGLRNRHIHELAEQVANDRDWVVVGDLGEILGSGDDVASECLQADGLHLTVECLNRIAASVSTTAPIG
jgi:hypothetical protein